MLYVVVQQPESGETACYNAHKGAGRFPSSVAIHTVMVQADGHELSAIEEQFYNVPMHEGRVVRWFGETAKFIVGNLKL